jgi:hypothetical protein
MSIHLVHLARLVLLIHDRGLFRPINSLDSTRLGIVCNTCDHDFIARLLDYSGASSYPARYYIVVPIIIMMATTIVHLV